MRGSTVHTSEFGTIIIIVLWYSAGTLVGVNSKLPDKSTCTRLVGVYSRCCGFIAILQWQRNYMTYFADSIKILL